MLWEEGGMRWLRVGLLVAAATAVAVAAGGARLISHEGKKVSGINQSCSVLLP